MTRHSPPVDSPPTTELAMTAADITVEIAGSTLLRQVDFSVPRGQVTAIIGPNGAGKSTLLGVLAGDITPTHGTVRLDGTPLGHYPVSQLARLRSVMLQKSAVAFSYSVREIVAMGRAPWTGADSPEPGPVVDRAMRSTRSDHLADRDVTTLSGGEQARAALARVIAQTTPLVLLDEPTASLDIAHQEHVLGLAGSLAAAGGTVIVVLHDLDAAATHADYVVALAGGRVAAAGPTSSVMTGPVLSELYDHHIDVIDHPLTGRPIVVPDRRR